MPAAIGNEKFCPRCHRTLAIDQFGRAKDRVDGLKTWCKNCRRDEGAADFQKHKTKRQKKHLEWKSRNPGAMNKYARRWRKRHPEKAKAVWAIANGKRDRARHREIVMRDYYADPQKHLDRARNWRQNNKAKVAAALKAYREENRELIAALKRNYKARKRNAEGQHTANDILRLYDEQSGRCRYCNNDLGKSYHVDHWMPLQLGGTNWPDNLQLLCGTCNLRKKDKEPTSFEAAIGFDPDQQSAPR